MELDRQPDDCYECQQSNGTKQTGTTQEKIACNFVVLCKKKKRHRSSGSSSTTIIIKRRGREDEREQENTQHVVAGAACFFCWCFSLATDTRYMRRHLFLRPAVVHIGITAVSDTRTQSQNIVEPSRFEQRVDSSRAATPFKRVWCSLNTIVLWCQKSGKCTR